MGRSEVAAEAPNVLVVMTDTLRPDYVGGYRRASDTADLPGQIDWPGGFGARTPVLDTFAAESTVFERTYVGSFPTVPNRNDLHTGRYTFPQRGWSALPAELPSLSEALGRRGYATQFFCDSPNQVPFGLYRGFQGWKWHRGQEGDRFGSDPRIEVPLPCAPRKLRNDGAPYRQHMKNRAWWQSEEDHYAPRTFRSGVAWMQQHWEAERERARKQEGAPRPFFLWLDTFDPHEPWDAPQYYVEWYDPGYTGEVIPHADYGSADYMSAAELRHVKALYAAEVSMVDKWFAKLLQQIDDLGYRENTVVVHVSDHGHYFGDHGLQGKPVQDLLWLYEGLIRQSLAVRFPGGRGRGRRVDSPVQPVDLTATILALAGADLPGSQGVSLLPAADGSTAGRREAAYSSRYPILRGDVTPCAITTAEWSYQYWPGSPEKERLFYLPSDPGQQHDKRQTRPEIARDLRATYLGWLRQQHPAMADWLTRIETEPAYRPDSPALFRGLI